MEPRFDWDCTLPVQVQRQKQEEKDRHPGRLVGNVGRRYLILEDVGPPPLEPGEPLIVRMLWRNSAIGFQSTVRDVVQREVSLVLVDYPQNVEVINLRRAERLPVFIPADVRAALSRGVSEDLLLLRAMILNISTGGCFFSSKKSVGEQCEVNLSFTLPGETFVYNLRGKVKQSVPRQEVYAQRVQFTSNGAESVTLHELGRWIDQSLAYAIESAPSTA